MKKIILTLFILIIATNVYAEVLFMNVGGRRITRSFEIKEFQHNETDIQSIKISVTHDVNGKFYGYTITPTFKDNEYIKSALVQFWCDPINLKFDKKAIIYDKGKVIKFIYGIDEELKKEVRVRVTLRLDDGKPLVFNIVDAMETAKTNEISEWQGGLQVKKDSTR